MTIAQAPMNKVKTDATIAVVRAKARAAQVNANAHVLKAKHMMKQAQAK
jgi:hypothetical protein